MQAEIVRDGIVEAFATEFRERWMSLPNRKLFVGLLVLWMGLFHFFGVSTFGYIPTASLQHWMLNAYVGNPDFQDDIHGVLVPFLVLGLFWWKRDQLMAVTPRLWWPALIGVGLSVLLHIAGYMVQQARVSIVAMFGGIYCLIGLVWGPRWMLRSFFPFVLFVFCIPMSTLPFFNDRITFPLRMLSAWIVEFIAHLGLAPDLVREGTQLAYEGPKHSWDVDIAPACSGIRGLTALTLMTVTYGMVVFREPWKRFVMVVSAVPLAVLNNVLRISFSVFVGRLFGGDALKAVEQKAGFYTFLLIAIPLVMLTGWLLGDRWSKSAETPKPAGGRAPCLPAVPGRPAGALSLFVLATVLMIGSAGALGWLKNHQRLGNPGVAVVPLDGAPEGSLNVKVDLPEWVGLYDSEERPVDDVVVNTLPADTSYGQRDYRAPDGMQIQVTAVLMGMDRTSIHKPQFCLVGAGWTILDQELTSVSIPRPTPYELPVSRITATRQIEYEGQQLQLNGVYVYWFVEENQITARHEDRMVSMARSMITKGVLQRWAYVSCFVQCSPGREDFTFERIKRFMEAGVPKFQIPGGREAVISASADRQNP